MKPVVELFKNETVEFTQLFTRAGLKFAAGLVYTRIGEIEAFELSHKLTAFILKTNWFPACPQLVVE